MNGELTSKERAQKVWWEFLDMLAGAAMPFIASIVFSSTILMFAEYSDISIRLLSIIGGLIFIIGAYVISGRFNGITAYKKYVGGEKKRQLNSSDKKAIYKTGEYALWKGFLIGFITTVPYIIFQVINLAAPNTFCEFILKYAFGWAYYPLKYFGAPEALNLVLILVPACVHAAAYFWGMKKGEKQQIELDKTNESKARRYVDFDEGKKGKSKKK